jgi:hypothetical protein
MLLWQAAGDLLGTATLGSCSRRLSSSALQSLLGCSHVLVAYDADSEGERGAEQVGQLLPHARRVRPPRGNDMTQFHQLGGHLRDWLQLELAPQQTATKPRTKLLEHKNRRSGRER